MLSRAALARFLLKSTQHFGFCQAPPGRAGGWLVFLGAFFFALSVQAANDAPARLAARAAGETPFAADLRELCDTIGGRPTGSEINRRAFDWAVQKFHDAGIGNAHLESFKVPALWLPDSAEGAVIAPLNFPVRVAAAPFTASTKGVLSAPVIDVGEPATASDFDKLAGKARGAILLVRSKEMKTFDDLFAEYMRNPVVLEGAKKTGAAAILFESTRPRGLLYRHPVNMGNGNEAIPAAVISREHAERIARLAAAGAVRMRLRLANHTGGAYEADNVVADIPGREKPDEVVLIGAHLDSWDLGTGAEDNGVNAAMLIDVARGFSQLGIRPRRTVRFVLFNGEEQGMWGSAGYVARHRAELDKVAAVAIFDTGSGKVSGFYLNGREDLRKPVNEALAAVPGLGATEHSADALDGTDNLDFLLSGVPNLVANQDPAPYLPDYHAESDVFERSNLDEQKRTEAIASALVYGLAESPERLKRQSRDEVESLITRTKLDEQMKLLGQWEDWKAGRRGLF